MAAPFAVSWDWQTPIDAFEGNGTPWPGEVVVWEEGELVFYNPGGSSSASIHVPANGATHVGDLLVVTIGMWMPSGGTPTVQFGSETSEGDPSTFVDETSDWMALAANVQGSVFQQSWYTFATSAQITRGKINVFVSGYDQPTWGGSTTHDGSAAMDHASTEGGVFYLNVIRNGVVPTIAYQDGGTGDTRTSPSVPTRQIVLHHYFGRSDGLTDTDSSGLGLSLTTTSPVSLDSGDWFWSQPRARTDLVPDNFPIGVGILGDDLYCAGFYIPRDKTGPDSTYTGQVTWDTTAPSGPGSQLAAIQGLVVGVVDQNLMMIL